MSEVVASSSSNDAVIRLRNVIKRFDGRTVLSGVTLDVMRGETLVVMGGSGCGKSTLLRMIIGSFYPDEGTIEVLGHEMTRLDEDDLNEVRKKFGILFQSGALFNSMSLRQNVALPLEEHTSLDPMTVDIMVKIKLELVGLREHAEKFPSQISGGMKKRAGLARALSLDPQILFYDEPSAGLDPVTSAEIDMLMINLSKRLGVTSVVVTHEMDSAFRIADRMVMLDKGRVLKIGRREEFEKLRDFKGELDETSALIRQFLRGDPEGPITQRKQSTAYADDLLGVDSEPRLTPKPSIQASRTMK